MIEALTEVQNESLTEASTEVMTEASTEVQTEAMTESPTEVMTEFQTEFQTEASTETQFFKRAICCSPIFGIEILRGFMGFMASEYRQPKSLSKSLSGISSMIFSFLNPAFSTSFTTALPETTKTLQGIFAPTKQFGSQLA